MTIKRVIAAVLLASTPACMATRQVAPAEYLAQAQPPTMLVVDEAGDVYVLERPVIVGENVVGIEMGTPDTMSVPVSHVYQAMVKEKSAGRTAMLVGTLAAVTGLAVAGVTMAGKGAPCKTVGASEDIIGGKDTCDTRGPDGGSVQ